MNISILSFCSRTAVRFNWFRVHSEHIIHLGPRRVLEVWSFWVLPEKFQTSSHQWHTMQRQASIYQRPGRWLQNLQMRWVWFHFFILNGFINEYLVFFLRPLISFLSHKLFLSTSILHLFRTFGSRQCLLWLTLLL